LPFAGAFAATSFFAGSGFLLVFGSGFTGFAAGFFAAAFVSFFAGITGFCVAFLGDGVGRDDLEAADDFARGFALFVDDFLTTALGVVFFATGFAAAFFATGFFTAAFAAGFFATDFFATGFDFAAGFFTAFFVAIMRHPHHAMSRGRDSCHRTQANSSASADCF
jgi:hypothetical protein